jgi:hypothetical protein
MKKSFLVNTIIIISSLFLISGISSCKKKDKTGDMGPVGAQGPQGNSELFNTMSDGYIQGTISGINKSGVPFTETYSYSILKNNVTESYVDSVNASTYDIGISRYAASHYGDGATFSFSASSMIPLTISSSSFNFNFTKPLGGNKYFVFSSNSSAIPTLSGLSYDKNTGIITGNYLLNLSSSENSTGNPANITGSFKVTLKPIWY